MIGPDSPLRRLPPQLDRTQALFFDGIRHAAEFIHFAHERLRADLTRLALSQYSGSTRGSFTQPFLDAWSIVDSVDRFRSLVALLPGIQGIPTPGSPSFAEFTQPIRDLRNVGDHLAQRADYVVARNGTALGILSWFTLVDSSKGRACTILPGTLRSGTAPFVNPAGRRIRPPTDLIELSAGEYWASLSLTVTAVRTMVTELERGLDEWLQEEGLTNSHSGSDILVVADLAFRDEPPPA